MEESLTSSELAIFKESEKYDLELYAYAMDIFSHRQQATGCPLI